LYPHSAFVNASTSLPSNHKLQLTYGSSENGLAKVEPKSEFVDGQMLKYVAQRIADVGRESGVYLAIVQIK